MGNERVPTDGSSPCEVQCASSGPVQTQPVGGHLAGANGAGKGVGVWRGETGGGLFQALWGSGRSGGGGRVFGLGVAVSVAVAVAVVVLSVLCSVVSPSAVLPVLSALVVGLVVMVAPVTVGSSSYKHRFRTRKTDKESESLRGTQTNFHLTASLVSQTLCYFRNL